jgi:hypothetical protein
MPMCLLFWIFHCVCCSGYSTAFTVLDMPLLAVLDMPQCLLFWISHCVSCSGYANAFGYSRYITAFYCSRYANLLTL